MSLSLWYPGFGFHPKLFKCHNCFFSFTSSNFRHSCWEFLGLGLVDLIDCFKDIYNQSPAWFLSVVWELVCRYVEDNKALKKLSDIGISLKRHIFVDNCQCTEFLMFLAKVSSFPFDFYFFYLLLCLSMQTSLNIFLFNRTNNLIC